MRARLVLCVLTACSKPSPAPATAAAGATVIRSDGVGPITATSPTASLASLFPALTPSTSHDEAEDHDFDTLTLSRGKTPVLDVVIDNMNTSPQIFRVDVYDASLATATGARTSSTIHTLASLYPDLLCRFERYDDDNAEHWNVSLFCTSASLPNISFHLDPAHFRGRPGKVPVSTIATRTLQRIIWMPPRKPAD